MATQVQYRRGTEAQNDAFTGALGEMTIDTTNGTMRVHNGVTAGGSNIATVAYVTTALSTLDSSKIYNGTSNVSVASANGPVSFFVNSSAIIRVTASGIENSQANVTGNIGNSTSYFNTVFAKATSAQYADLAEMYVADADYVSGTVVEFGGDKEVTVSNTSHSTAVAGIVSTNPSYLMNATQTGEHVIAVALVGRVPCQVIGTFNKGDRLVASELAGVATVLDMSKYEPGCIIGKALESYASDSVGVIEVAVGRD
jgi:hypothetical protein